jgi:hypothetical protein
MREQTSIVNLPGLHNVFGTLNRSMRHRLRQVIQNPRKYWDRDHGIILNATDKHLTLWQAVLRVDPSFPRVGPSSNSKGERLEDWQRYPTPELLRAAILYAAPTPLFGPAQKFEVM